MKNDDNECSRLVDLEGHFVHAEQTIQDLSDLVRKQWDEIGNLNKRLRQLDDRISELEHRSDTSDGADGERPPHY